MLVKVAIGRPPINLLLCWQQTPGWFLIARPILTRLIYLHLAFLMHSLLFFWFLAQELVYRCPDINLMLGLFHGSNFLVKYFIIDELACKESPP